MNEQEWKRILQEEPAQGLSAAIDEYGDCIKWIVSKIIGQGQAQDIEECVSDVFVKLWKGISRFDTEAGVSLKSYLCGIARHTALDYRRAGGRHEPWIPVEEANLQINVDFENEITAKSNGKLLQDTIDELPSPDKDIFILRYFLGERVSSIADRLQLPQKTIENKLYRGRLRLKKRLLEKGVIR